MADVARTLRESIKYYGSCRRHFSAEDAAVVAEHIATSTAFSDHQKQYAAKPDTKYCVKYVTWGGRKQKALHMIYIGADGLSKSLALTLGKLEARPKTRQVRKRSTPERNKVLGACRAVITPQIAAYRKAFWAAYAKRVEVALSLQMDPPKWPRCKLSGKSLRSAATHVDHAYPFVRLVSDWLESEGLTADEVGKQTGYRRSLKRASMGEALDASWYAYHAKHAVLELVEAKANMSKGAKVTEQSLVMAAEGDNPGQSVL